MMIRWIEVAGNDGTVANGVTPDGTIAGVTREGGGRVRGFLLRDVAGSPEIFDAPGAADTFLQDIAPGEVVIGDATDGERSWAFLMRAGDVQPVRPPGAVDAWAGGVLSNGDCCGCFRDEKDRRVGFRRRAGRFEEILPAGAESAVVLGMGADGEVVGACSLAGQAGGFLLRTDGRVEWLDPPRGEFVPADCAEGGSWVVGSFVARDGLSQAGELREGRWRTIELPGGPFLESAAVGCCVGVGVVGWALDASGRKRGFLLDERGA